MASVSQVSSQIIGSFKNGKVSATTKENLENSPFSGKLKLYSYWRSSCAWRVRIALNLKGLPYEYKAVNLVKGEQFSEEYTKLNPLQFVPTLVDGDIIVSDSLAILLYLEDKYPEHPLLPDDLQLKATSLQKRVEEKLGSGEGSAWAKSFIERGFTALEKLLKNVSRKYCVGDQVTLADVFLAPQVAGAAGRFNVDMSKFPTLSKINEALIQIPEFQAAVPEKQPDVKGT